jgi:hypothetical protein
MSLCLALFLAAVAINWWHGWKPFTHPFQMPKPMAKASFSHSQAAQAIEPPIGRRCARAAERPLGGSHQQPWIGFRPRPRRCLRPRSR